MNVFLSWSGSRSQQLAAALSNWLPYNMQNITCWLSENDIAAGARWASELTAKLKSCDAGILCLTPENLKSPWLLFEAGSLAKNFEVSHVIPYRLGLGVSDIEYPLAQFQGVDANKNGTRKLLDSLNSATEEAIDNAFLDRTFEMWWPELEGKIQRISPQTDALDEPRNDRALLEESLELSRMQVEVLLPLVLKQHDDRAFEKHGDFDRSRNGLTADICWRREGFTHEMALELSGVLKHFGIPCRLTEHRNNRMPDSLFIGALVDLDSARQVMSAIPYQIHFLFRPDYPEDEGGSDSGQRIGIGYSSEHYREGRGVLSEPVAVQPSDLSQLIEQGVSNLEFQRRLRKLTECE